MKKLHSTMLLIMTVTALILTACSSDDDNSEQENYSENNSVVGTWMGYSCADGNPNDLSKKHTLTLVFNSDGSGNYLEKDDIFTDKCAFTYQMEGSTKGKTYIKTRGNTIYFVIEDGKMYVYGHGYGDDLDFLLTKQ